MDLSMKNLKSEDVDSLYGLTLNIAFSIYVENWQWLEFPNTETPYILLDKPLPEKTFPKKQCAIYLGDNHFVFKKIPKYNESINKMIKLGRKLNSIGYGWHYSKYIEEELKSSDHIKMLNCSADKRARAILKLIIDYPQIKERL